MLSYQRLKTPQKVALAVTLYAALYFVLAWLTAPAPLRIYVSEEHKIRNRHVLVFLWPDESVPASAGAQAFRDERCAWCFFVGDKEFMPVSEYDAILVRADRLDSFRQTDSRGRALDKLYVLNSTTQCSSAKFQECQASSALDSRATFDLCGLCEHVRSERKPRPFVII